MHHRQNQVWWLVALPKAFVTGLDCLSHRVSAILVESHPSKVTRQAVRPSLSPSVHVPGRMRLRQRKLAAGGG